MVVSIFSNKLFSFIKLIQSNSEGMFILLQNIIMKYFLSKNDKNK